MAKQWQDIENPKKRGDAGMGIAIGWFSQRCTVCIPLTDSQSYDLVVDMNGLKRVQVKTTVCSRNGRYEVFLATRGGNRSGTGKTRKFSARSADILFVVVGDGSMYLIPSSDVGGKTGIVLGEKYARYKVS